MAEKTVEKQTKMMGVRGDHSVRCPRESKPATPMSAPRPKVVITDWTFADLRIEEEILKPAGCELAARQCRTEAELSALVAEADCVLTQFAPLTPNVIRAMTRTRAIVRYGVGVDNVNLEAATQRRIPVCNVPDYCIHEVADHTLALILALTRQIPQVANRVRAGQWRSALELQKMSALQSLTVGVVGFGRIGREVVQRLRAFHATVLAHDPAAAARDMTAVGAEAVSFEELLRASDVISLHCPSTPQTRHLIHRGTLARMKRGVILINVARGTVVQQSDVLAALQSGQVAAAGLDVTDPEPIPDDHPLLRMENVIITNHVASCSPAAFVTLRTRAAETAALAVQGGKLPNVVNPEALTCS